MTSGDANSSTRMQPTRQQRIRIDVGVLIEMHALLAQQPLQPTFMEGGHGFRGAADPLATDEDLRNRAAADARGEHRADPAAAVVYLVVRGIQIDRAIWNRTRR